MLNIYNSNTNKKYVFKYLFSVLIIILCDVIADAANVKYENASLLTSDDDCTIGQFHKR